MRIPSPLSPKKSLMDMSSILTPTLLNLINLMVILILALLQMIPPQSPTTTIFPLSLQTLLMTPGNTMGSIESNTIQIVKTTTAAPMLACTIMGIVTFPPPDAQFAEPTDMDVWTALMRTQFIKGRRNSSRVSETLGNLKLPLSLLTTPHPLRLPILTYASLTLKKLLTALIGGLGKNGQSGTLLLPATIHGVKLNEKTHGTTTSR